MVLRRRAAGRARAAAVAVALATAALAGSPAEAGASERCCFLIDAHVSGWATWTVGEDLERPGAYAYRVRWSWGVRHFARYVEHGRIFNALTVPRTDRWAPSSLAVRLSETRAGIRGAACTRSVEHRLAVPRDRAYVSLEDTTAGTVALVARVHSPWLRARCVPAFAIPRAHVAPAPAGVVLRGARAITRAWRERISSGGPAGLRGAVHVRVRLSPRPETSRATNEHLAASKKT